jgi:chemotaxis protein methyltransferase CheR
MSAAFAEIAAHIQARSGLALGPEKLYLLETRLAPILRREKLADLRALAQNISRNETLSRAVVEAMTTNESLFFRDNTPFQHLREVALPALHRTRPPGQKLRIWSAAASSGQEAYSLAMTVSEIPRLLEDRGVEIIGTDIATAPLERARAGRYTPFEVQRGLTGAQLARYFTRDGEQWRAAPALRAMVNFREWNLLASLAPLGMFDIVFCRNVLIYFDPPTKARVLAAIKRQMAPDALLYLGASETTMGIAPDLVRAAAGCGVYSMTEAA